MTAVGPGGTGEVSGGGAGGAAGHAGDAEPGGPGRGRGGRGRSGDAGAAGAGRRGADPGGAAVSEGGAAGGRRSEGVVRVWALVTGRVQGVWYRQACRREAERLGVAGWVANRPDGSVELEAEGARAAVEGLLAWARRGPARAVVERLAVEDLPPRGETGFRVRG